MKSFDDDDEKKSYGKWYENVSRKTYEACNKNTTCFIFFPDDKSFEIWGSISERKKST